MLSSHVILQHSMVYVISLHSTAYVCQDTAIPTVLVSGTSEDACKCCQAITRAAMPCVTGTECVSRLYSVTM